MVSGDGFVYRYDLVNFKMKGDGSIDRGCDFRSCMFIQTVGGSGKDQTMQYKLLTVGSDNQRALCRIYNDNDDVETSYRDDADDPSLKPLKKFSEVAFLNSTSQSNPFNNILVGTE